MSVDHKLFPKGRSLTNFVVSDTKANTDMRNSHTEELDLDDEVLDSVAARGKGLSQIPYPTLLDLAIRGKDDSFKARVWEIVVQTGLDPDDPAFLMMIATGRLQVLLEDNPKEMEAMFDLWQTQLYDHLQTYEKAAVKGQQKAIASKGCYPVYSQPSQQQFYWTNSIIQVNKGGTAPTVEVKPAQLSNQQIHELMTSKLSSRTITTFLSIIQNFSV